MSQMAILLLLAAAQIDDRGWQPNTNVGETVRSAREKQETPLVDNVNSYDVERQRLTNSQSVEPASFDALGDGYVDGYGDDILGDDYASDFDLENERDTANRNARQREHNAAQLPADRNVNRSYSRDDPRTESRSPGRSDVIDAADRAFWDAHDLFLDETLEFGQVPQPKRHRFRRVDSWALPIPIVPVRTSEGQFADPNSDIIQRDPVDRLGDRRYAGSDRRTNDRHDASDEFTSPTDYRARDYFIGANDVSTDVRRPSNEARQLNDDAQQPTPVANQTKDVDDAKIRKAMDTLDFTRMWQLARGPSAAAHVGNQEDLKNGNTQPGSGVYLAANRSWWPFLLATLGLFASLGFNFYLGWIAWDIHGRYQDAVADLTEIESKGDERSPSHLESDNSDAFSNRSDRSRTRRRSISI